jgi:hypothetical protein
MTVGNRRARRRQVLRGSILAAMVAGLTFSVLRCAFDPIDRCLDGGGRWNQQASRCETR